MSGKLIVLEGIDGSGKSTQFELLTNRLDNEGIPFRKLVFPRYSESSSAMLRSYLNGEFGKNPEDVSAYAASTFFFIDRYASYKTDWCNFYKSGGLVICDRYTTSNAIHQGAKLSPSALPDFLDWLYDFEFRIMELPVPDLVLYMDIDLVTCLAQMEMRQKKTGIPGDIHETHREYLSSCLIAGNTAANRLNWTRVSCLNNSLMRPEEDIGRDIYRTVKEVL